MYGKAAVLKNLLIFGTASFLIFMVGCKNAPTDPGAIEATTNTQAMLKLAESDSAVSSFQPNYDEEGAMGVLTSDLGLNIYPIKVGQKLRLVSKNFTYTTSGDTAYGKYTQTFEGVLFIAASSSPDSSRRDTVIQKPFTSVVTRNIIFVRTGNTNLPVMNWKIVAVSLPQGGTAISNVNISQVTVFLASGDTLIVNNPNDYYMYRENEGHKNKYKWWKDIPEINEGSPVTIQVKVNSAYADTDFVTLTHGADFRGYHREKMKFNLISSAPSANGYTKIYQQTFTTEHSEGYFHAVINAYSKQEINDNTSPVEISSWGVPYYVKW